MTVSQEIKLLFVSYFPFSSFFLTTDNFASPRCQRHDLSRLMMEEKETGWSFALFSPSTDGGQPVSSPPWCPSGTRCQILACLWSKRPHLFLWFCCLFSWASSLSGASGFFWTPIGACQPQPGLMDLKVWRKGSLTMPLLSRGSRTHSWGGEVLHVLTRILFHQCSQQIKF